MSSRQETLDRVAGIVAAFNRHDAAAVGDDYAADVTVTNTRGEERRGRDQVVRALQDVFSAYPDARMETMLVIAPREDTAVVEFSITGTHGGRLRLHGDDFVFAATERPVTWEGVHILSFDASGKVKRSELQTNPAEVLEQIGSGAPPPATAGVQRRSAGPSRPRPAVGQTTRLSPDELRRVQEKLEVAINRWDPAACAGLYKKDAVLRAPGEPEVRGRQAIQRWYRLFFDGFPDLKHKADDILVDDNTMVVHWTGWGTHGGPLGPLPPSGKQVEIHGAIVNIFSPTGLIQDATWYWDNLHFMKQLGLSPR